MMGHTYLKIDENHCRVEIWGPNTGHPTRVQCSRRGTHLARTARGMFKLCGQHKRKAKEGRGVWIVMGPRPSEFIESRMFLRAQWEEVS